MQGNTVAYVFHFCGLVRENNKRTAGGGGGGWIKHTYKGDFDPASGEAEYIEKDCKK